MQFARDSRARGPTGVASVSADGRTVEMTPVAELRAGEAPVYQIEVFGTRPGKHKVTATVASVRTPAGVAAQAETTVNAP
jgi:hypothetical protein